MSELRYGNVTDVSCVNNMGDIKSQTCNNIAIMPTKFGFLC